MTKIDQARIMFEQGHYAEAADLLQSNVPDLSDSEAQLLLAVSLIRCRRTSEAVKVLEELLARYPDTYDALTWLSVLTKEVGSGERAVGYAERGIELRPQDAKGYSALGVCHQYHRRMDLAIPALERAAQLDPAAAEHQHNLGLAYQILFESERARRCFRRAIELAPLRVESYVALAEDYALYGSAKAFDTVQEGLKAIPKAAPLHSLMGKILTRLNRHDEAEQHFQYAGQLTPRGVYAYAAWLVEQGRFDESAFIYRELLRTNPVQGVGYYGLSQSQRLKPDDIELIESMTSIRDRQVLGPFEQMHLLYALAKAEEQIGHFEASMRDYDEANRLAFNIHLAGSPATPATTERDDRLVERTYERLRRGNWRGSPSEAPIFIIGMIRSGTTLLDQILSSHSSVVSAGEMGFWIRTSVSYARKFGSPSLDDLRLPTEDYLRNIERLVGQPKRFTDKMPLNYAYSGLIGAALPNARFIHIRRNPIDTCLSIYTTYFGPGTPSAYDKANIVAYYREYQRSMSYWRNVLNSDALLEIEYEDLVSNPGQVVPKIIAFCGLDWEDACLHPESNAAAILTPSRWQARQPINRGSVDRWRHFEPWLGKFAELRS